MSREGQDRDVAPCRSCRRMVRWARSATSGKPMPLDEDLERGNVLIDEMGRAVVFGNHGKALAAAEELECFGGSTRTFISHHAEGQCPQGRAWKDTPRGSPWEPLAAPEPAQRSLLDADTPVVAPASAILGE